VYYWLRVETKEENKRMCDFKEKMLFMCKFWIGEKKSVNKVSKGGSW